ncbi:sugar ABC transporter permease [Lichenicoccus roseus]|uniref:Xylose transport system permease protein XylH n=1 Tax=Lichenicoccus roseus TaxID=2683649 RepID=A0A5R9J7Y5_9PROT|nr:sugar ABC transporter permease [Lichenicoccus roseus]TLU73692.1 sugar ABC transporter permease [Lichenicoccus roseus]
MNKPALASTATATAPSGAARNPGFGVKLDHVKGAFSRYKILALLLAIAVIWALFWQLTDGDFLTARNFSNLLRQMSITGMLAAGMVFVIVSGEIDLSIGSLLGLLGGVAAILDVTYHMPLPVTLLVVMILGIAAGMFNGYWVAYLRVPSFIVTLAGMLVFRGILLGITGGVTISPTSAPLIAIGQSYLPDLVTYVMAAAVLGLLVFVSAQGRNRRQHHQLEVPALWLDGLKLFVAAAAIGGFVYAVNSYRGMPTPVLVLLVLLGVFTLMARRTVFGRRIYAIGGNLEATRLSGVNVQRVKLLVFALMGLMAAFAGITTTARLAAGSPSAGSLQELDAIASCVIGGTSLRGGSGTVFGALIGALIMASLDNGMSMLSVDTFWQMIVKGVILLLAVWLDIATGTKR